MNKGWIKKKLATHLIGYWVGEVEPPNAAGEEKKIWARMLLLQNTK